MYPANLTYTLGTDETLIMLHVGDAITIQTFFSDAVPTVDWLCESFIMEHFYLEGAPPPSVRIWEFCHDLQPNQIADLDLVEIEEIIQRCDNTTKEPDPEDE
jgi:hypothetical protein